MQLAFDLEAFISKYVTKRPVGLLDADMVHFENDLKREIDGSSVLVVGGAGTIGAHFIKALLKFKPKRLVVVDTNENGLTELVRDLRSQEGFHIPADFITYTFNLGDPVFVKMFTATGPYDIVANFAAHKHVRSEKDIFSIEAMFDNNVVKAKRLLELLRRMPPKHFFCVSTDKAANPVNMMGATKKMMEDMVLAYSKYFPVTTARFANVAFSNGSLPLAFLERFARRQPWSCPVGIRRFFVSPLEAGLLCLIACVLGKSGRIFFPKLDEQRDMIPFDQIALDLCKALGYEPLICKTEDEARRAARKLSEPHNRQYPIYFFESDTSGEKTFEEFYTDREILDLNRFESLGTIENAPIYSITEINKRIRSVNQVFKLPGAQKADLVKALKVYLPDFDHIEKGKHLDQRM